MIYEDFEDFDLDFYDDRSSDNDDEKQQMNYSDDQIGYLVRAVVNRQYGFHDNKSKKANYNPIRFKHHVRDSLYLMKSMSQCTEMFEHLEPIYSVDFNHNGQYICSAGNDCKVAIWNWSENNLDYIYDSGHTLGSVNCCRWSPLNDECITTCGDDGFVRNAMIDRSLITHSRVTCFHDSMVDEFVYCDPCVILSAGQDGQIFQCDLRQQSSFELLNIRRKKKGAFRLQTIDCNRQIRPHLFAVAGHGSYALVYDRRFINNSRKNHVPYSKYCLSYLAMNENDNDRFSVPCVRISPNGNNLLCSTSTGVMALTKMDSENNFFFRVLAGQGVKLFSEPIFKCCWFGDRFAFSTSNDGFLYAWNIDDKKMIFFKIGDEIGNVNALCAHPLDPILATAGTNRSVKIWSPNFDDDIVDYDIELIREKIIGNFRARYISNTYHKTLKDVEEISYLMSIRNIFDDDDEIGYGEFWRSHQNNDTMGQVSDNNNNNNNINDETFDSLYADLYEFFVVNAHHFP